MGREHKENQKRMMIRKPKENCREEWLAVSFKMETKKYSLEIFTRVAV